MIKTLIAVFVGGGLGSIMRYGAQLLLHERIAPYNFPWATFAVNIAGSFLIGLFYALSAKFSLSDDARVFLTAGLCGGFTTFSTFSNDSLALLRQGEVGIFVCYAVMSVALGILAALGGASIIK